MVYTIHNFVEQWNSFERKEAYEKTKQKSKFENTCTKNRKKRKAKK